MRLTKAQKLQLVICPHCNIDMERLEIEVPGPNVFIDYCPKCNSYWFDKGEFRKIVKDRLAEKNVGKQEGMNEWVKFGCPRCGENMRMKFMYNVEVDQCDECGGIWLDDGELLQLKEKYLERIQDKHARGFFNKLYTLKMDRE